MSVLANDPRTQARQQLDEAIARIGRLKAVGNFTDARRALRDAAAAIFGPIGYTIEQVDAQSAARLLVSCERITTAAVLLAEVADLDELRGEANSARAGRRRALELYLEAAMLSPDPTAEARAAISLLRPMADEWRLAERYQLVLASL
jgi:hypothetical protein